MFLNYCLDDVIVKLVWKVCRELKVITFGQFGGKFFFVDLNFEFLIIQGLS